MVERDKSFYPLLVSISVLLFASGMMLIDTSNPATYPAGLLLIPFIFIVGAFIYGISEGIIRGRPK